MEKVTHRLSNYMNDPFSFFGFGLRSLALKVFPPKDEFLSRLSHWDRSGNLPRVTLDECFPNITKDNIALKHAFDRKVNTSIDCWELFILCAIVKHIQPKNLLEIGTYDGNTTLNLALNAGDDSKITTLDLPENFDGDWSMDIPQPYQNVTNRQIVGRQFKNTPEEKKIQQVFGDSTKIDWKKMGAPFDFIFIDGCHHYKYAKKDSENAFKHIAPNGVIVWHDYGMIRDVSKAVDEFKKEANLYAISGTRLALAIN